MANPLSARRSRKPRTSSSRLSSDALAIPDLNEFSALSLYDSATAQNNTLGNAYLLALSTGFYKYAKTKAQEFGTATDAELTLVLNRVSDDLADDGRLQPGPFIREFVAAIRSLSPETIAANLRSRSLVDYPQGLGVPGHLGLSRACALAPSIVHGAPAPRCRRLWLATPPPCMLARSTCLAASTHALRAVSTRSYAYDPVANEWTPKRPMPQMRFFTAGVAAHTIGDKIYVVMGGTTYLQPQNKLYAYDPVADQWSVEADRPTYRADFASAVVNGLLYVIGGYGQVDNGPGNLSGEFKSHVEIYDPATDRWSTGAPLPTALSRGQCLRIRQSDLRVRGCERRRLGSVDPYVRHDVELMVCEISDAQRALRLRLRHRRRCRVPAGRIWNYDSRHLRHGGEIRPVRGDMVISDAHADAPPGTLGGGRRQSNLHDRRVGALRERSGPERSARGRSRDFGHRTALTAALSRDDAIVRTHAAPWTP